MLDLFLRKRKIQPLLKGLVDIHNHVLPGIDDGSKSVEESEEMLKIYESLGFHGVVATPHVLKSAYDNTYQTITDAAKRLKGNSLFKSYAAEFMLEDAVIAQILNKDLLIFDKFALCEFSYFQPPYNYTELIDHLIYNNIQIIIAHPERYLYWNKAEIKNLKGRGCLLQLNILSLSGHYGDKAQKNAQLILRDDLYDLAATDAHKAAHLEKISRMTIGIKDYLAFAKISQRQLEWQESYFFQN